MKRAALAAICAVMPWIVSSKIRLGLWSVAFLITGVLFGVSLMGERERWLRFVGIAEAYLCSFGDHAGRLGCYRCITRFVAHEPAGEMVSLGICNRVLESSLG
jgi:hypothetical protein